MPNKINIFKLNSEITRDWSHHGLRLLGVRISFVKIKYLFNQKPIYKLLYTFFFDNFQAILCNLPSDNFIIESKHHQRNILIRDNLYEIFGEMKLRSDL